MPEEFLFQLLQVETGICLGMPNPNGKEIGMGANDAADRESALTQTRNTGWCESARTFSILNFKAKGKHNA